MKTSITLLLLISGLAFVSGQNGNQQADSMIMELWDETEGAWALWGKGENIFNVNGQLITTIGYFSDEGNWIPGEKTEYTYDANGNRILETEYEAEGPGEWGVTEKREYSVDASGKDTLELSFDWDSDSQTWQPEGKSEFTYDASGNLTMLIKYRTEGSGNPWIPQWKFAYEYDVHGNDTLETTYRWDESGEKWDPSEKIEQTFDGDGNVILHYHEYWDENTSQWVFQDREKYEYVVTDSAKQETTYDWDESGSKWDPIYRMTYYYSDPGITNIQNFPFEEVRVYPNPAMEFIVFEGMKTQGAACIELFDIQGRIVLCQEIKNGQKVSVQHLSQGLYLYKYSADNRIYSGKLIIK